ncbi:MAG TPA: thiamine pyrophosphate-dependent enzyme [Bryobacteraceae bacterium]|jgi:pyruvate/2-oxoacid:ferredoxin oxidoreductase beta subunit/NAD-dependent dihydropyrimidine dehydrogenase PreA subunit|nr:thiamine pyrophosphate-dependent enzyme [Bryobacteraceae bacterium]
MSAIAWETRMADITANVVDIADFNERVVGAYNTGLAERGLPADAMTARSVVPAGTGALRDFSYIAPDIPEFIAANCVGCMECVTECPDTAILGKVAEPAVLEERLAAIPDESLRKEMAAQWTVTNKYFTVLEKKGQGGGKFGIFIDPTKCKGCAECVDACGDHNALRMVRKNDENMRSIRGWFDFYKSMPETPARFINEKALADMMLAERSLLYVGGAGSCMGCGEATALRMMLAATGFLYGQENVGIVAATGCNTVYTSTYPYNPYLVSWTNSLFENAPADAMGVRARWDQQGWHAKRLWIVGGDGAMLDIGFQSLSRMLASGADIKVLVLDTQVYSNTGGQSSTSSFKGQDAKMSFHGSAIQGKKENRKELGNICMMHKDVYVAQTTCAHMNHFYKAIMEANQFHGPAIVNVFTTCQPEHGVGDNMAEHQAKLAADSRSFPLFIYDPRKGPRIKDRLSLVGNPNVKDDWYTNPKTGEPVDFITFARSEGRFAKHFDKDGNPSETLLATKQERLENWHLLQELAGIR